MNSLNKVNKEKYRVFPEIAYFIFITIGCNPLLSMNVILSFCVLFERYHAGEKISFDKVKILKAVRNISQRQF